MGLTKKLFLYLFYFWLCLVLVVACGIFPCGTMQSLPWGPGAQSLCTGLLTPGHVGSKFPDQGLNLHLPHWKADS